MRKRKLKPRELRPARPPCVLKKSDRELRVQYLNPQQQIALLSVHKQPSYKVAAELLGCSMGTLKTRVYRARLALLKMRKEDRCES